MCVALNGATARARARWQNQSIALIDTDDWGMMCSKKIFRSWWSTDGWIIATLSSTWGHRSVFFEIIWKFHSNITILIVCSAGKLWIPCSCSGPTRWAQVNLIIVTIPERFICIFVCCSKYHFYWPLSFWNIHLFPFFHSDSLLIVVICTRNGTKWLLPPRTPLPWSRTGFVTIISTMNIKMF